jgi:hypothetical protein
MYYGMYYSYLQNPISGGWERHGAEHIGCQVGLGFVSDPTGYLGILTDRRLHRNTFTHTLAGEATSLLLSDA